MRKRRVTGVATVECPRCEACGRPLPRGEKGPWGKARDRSGLSTREAATRSGLSASTISRADYDGDALSLGAAARLAKVYGVPLESMIDDASTPASP